MNEIIKKSTSILQVKERCILLLDCSASMNEKVDNKKKIDILIDAIPCLKTPYSNYALIVFNDDAKIIRYVTNKFGNIISISQGLIAFGETRMDLGLSTSFDLFNSYYEMVYYNDSNRKRIILLSDGCPSCSEDSIIKEVKKCKKSGITIDTIAIGYNSSLLQTISEMTEGIYKESKDFDIEKVFKELKYETRYIGYDNNH